MSTIGMIFGEIANPAPAPAEGTGESKPVDLYENLQLNTQNDWTIPLAYLTILVAAVYADGVATEEELEYVRSLVKRCSTMRGQTQNSLTQLNIDAMDRIRTRHDFLSEACAILPRHMHQSLFAHCVDIVLSDGDLAEKERDLLDALVEKMALKPEEARKIMEVIFAKNRY